MNLAAVGMSVDCSASHVATKDAQERQRGLSLTRLGRWCLRLAPTCVMLELETLQRVSSLGVLGGEMRTRLDPNARHEMMSRFRKRNSGPELALRRELRALGVRYSAYPDLFGSPDIVLKGTRTVIFVHGCFWHGCPHHYRRPQTSQQYWTEKLERNWARDRRVARKLRRGGWSVLTVWECEVNRSARRVAERIFGRANANRHRAQEL